jgi:cytochrome bd-type quinol oxidase subunit 1
VYGLMRTSQGVSATVPVGQVWTTIALFGMVYAGLLVLYLFLLNQKIQHGPDVEHASVPLEGERHPWDAPAGSILVSQQRADL